MFQFINHYIFPFIKDVVAPIATVCVAYWAARIAQRSAIVAKEVSETAKEQLSMMRNMVGITREQLNSMRSSSSGSLLKELWEQFDSTNMRNLRKEAANSLKEEANPENPFFSEELDRLCCWFEMLGILVRTEALLLEHAREHFRYWIWSYWAATEKQIQNYRTKENEKEYYNHFEWLVNSILEEKPSVLEKTPSKNSLPNERDVKCFLEDESSLTTKDLVSAGISVKKEKKRQ